MTNFKTIIPRQILILTILAVVLNVGRIFLFDKLSLIYILWNIFLAFIPFFISSILLKYLNENKLKIPVFIVGGIFWLLFFPNAPYLVTDLIHVGTLRFVPILYDVLLLFSSALVGLLLAMYSLSHIEKILRIKYGGHLTSVIVPIIIVVTSFGIYLGRFLRFNSWDVFTNHPSLLKSVLDIFTNSVNSTEAFLYTILFSFFIYMSYNAWRSENIK